MFKAPVIVLAQFTAIRAADEKTVTVERTLSANRDAERPRKDRSIKKLISFSSVGTVKSAPS